ncbi:hypothetical protein [Candidatus Solirubrobacter pratensis]|uniref:hypothetical protein n=1 Tax=Candidatus Solirubrobacter pratensis TaxID=1298857 RepID=UPI0004825CFD|nr:hypothetical protein [Candidatus Solirubrobacter pratensis]
MTAVTVAALAGSSAAGAATFPLEVTPVAPANGSTITMPASSSTLAFEFTGSVPASVNGSTVEISRSPTLGQDGTLADDLNAGIGFVNRRDSDPTRFAGSAVIPNLSQPGPFYFQFHSFAIDYSASATKICPDSGQYGGSCTLASSVYSFTVAAPQPPAPPAARQPPAQSQPSDGLPLSNATARRAARALAIRFYGARSPKVVSMHRIDVSRVKCRVSWRTKSGAKRSRMMKVRRTTWGGVDAYLA